jgi:hypothetical protein
VWKYCKVCRQYAWSHPSSHTFPTAPPAIIREFTSLPSHITCLEIPVQAACMTGDCEQTTALCTGNLVPLQMKVRSESSKLVYKTQEKEWVAHVPVPAVSCRSKSQLLKLSFGLSDHSWRKPRETCALANSGRLRPRQGWEVRRFEYSFRLLVTRLPTGTEYHARLWLPDSSVSVAYGLLC